MKLKTTQIDGKTYAEVNEQGLPLYIHDDGKEVAHDAAQTVATITRINGEAKSNRERYEKAETALTTFAGIEDPVAAKKAMETLKNFDDKKLVDAGEVEKVKAEAIKAVEEKYAPIVQERDALQNQLHGELIGGGFARSQMIKDKISVPADMVQAQFGRNFKVENGKVVAYDNHGQQIYSRSRPGELADFDEALDQLIDGYQYKDHILKGGQGSGGNFQGNTNTNTGLKRSQMDAKAKSDFIQTHGQAAYLKLEK
ncbi:MULTISPECIES: DUF6651 domain-containing protein [unclassified Acinetobacter]|uniref:DUF6651 domain-containing protein n=1 Tax=unclassified Acinetobacter TaxID=196816 RepID=UPI0025767D60|nr:MULTISPECIES: DUF6651 domain-containing protein [unclassified Acinetobacter]MDM1764592.1 hypothetical protein [Acinetobacter sp. 226-1]MDM1768588.1 hypothetical protein [Acinetobacter sp. 226-4]